MRRANGYEDTAGRRFRVGTVPDPETIIPNPEATVMLEGHELWIGEFEAVAGSTFQVEESDNTIWKLTAPDGTEFPSRAGVPIDLAASGTYTLTVQESRYRSPGDATFTFRVTGP